MKNLLYKEFRLASHPAAFLFLGLAAMMMIPNYPLTVTFFYPCLGAFFICLNGRENRDVCWYISDKGMKHEKNLPACEAVRPGFSPSLDINKPCASCLHSFPLF